MGQKVDARIFRLGVGKKNWELKHIEKNNEESSLYLYKTLEIQKYLNRFFSLYKVKIHNCKIFYSNNSLQLFISFYITEKTIYIINKNLTKYQKKLSIRFKRPCIQKKNKKSILSYKPNLKQTMMLQEFQDILLESLTIYTKGKVNIFVTMQNLNNQKNLSYNRIKNWKTIFKQLKKFVRNSFFKEAINILFVNITKRKSAKLLAEFISDQFKINQLKTDQMAISRKDNYFLGFLKQTIKLLINAEVSGLTGIKIVIKGRFNRAPRAKSVTIQFGKFSLQSFDSKIDYFQSTAYTINGTFGVKVWMREN
jgi:ribosomal protein S3|uniref:Ribosomal protein S3 n=1 Tax=Thalassiosira pseudonana TaxID=35128 RepID=Q3S286_THAPS|nr:ribosomal protein S3 [Thalassiosira pseudonana]AAZ99418.1 ribosomal protein S3 [Thalassiosira pseudonana]QWM92938.1 ribosomal protein S3 [Thalassiosira pseudonana]